MHWQQAGQLFNFIYTLSHLFIYSSHRSGVDAMYEVMLIILNINDKRKENFYQYTRDNFRLSQATHKIEILWWIYVNFHSMKAKCLESSLKLVWRHNWTETSRPIHEYTCQLLTWLVAPTIRTLSFQRYVVTFLKSTDELRNVLNVWL